MFTVLYRSHCRYIKNVKQLTNIYNVLCTSASDTKNFVQLKKPNKDVLGSIGTKYKVFRNEDSSVVLDINESKYSSPFNIINEEIDEFEGLNLERGISGVYEIEDLVSVLKRENAQNVFVALVPPEWKYVDYICVVSGRSYRHMLAIAQFVRRLHKIKRNPNDILPKIEGENSKEWIAMDLGNIALHIFSSEAREKYDLDSLWSVGEEYDDECNKPDDPIVQLLQQHSTFFQNLQPADSKS